MATIVYSKEELKKAITNNAFPIKVKGEFAKQLIIKYKRRKKIKKDLLSQVVRLY